MNRSSRMAGLQPVRAVLGAALLSLAAGAGAQTATDQLVVSGLQKTAETRVGRTVFEYTFKATIKNKGTAAVAGATAQLTSAAAGTTIVDGKVAINTIAAGASVTPDDPIVLRIDRSKPFDSAALVWQVSAGPAASAWTGVRQDIAPISFDRATNADHNSSQGTGVATDAQGNVIVVGSSNGGFTAEETLSENSGPFAAKYSPAGQLLWVRRVLGPDNSLGLEKGLYRVGVDASGNIYVAGEAINALPNELSAGARDVFIAKLDSAGNQVWAHQFGSNQEDHLRGIAVDTNGNAVIVGYSVGQLPLQPPPNGEDFFIAKYDSAGSRLFLNAIDLSGDEEAQGVALDKAGNIYVTGSTNQRATDFLGFKGFAAKYNGSGVQQWLALVGESVTPLVQPYGIAVSADGAAVYLAGRTYQDFDVAGQPQVAPNCCVQGDAFVARLNGANGARSWAHNLSSQTLSGDRRFDDSAFGVATDATGSAAYITGYTAGVIPGETSKGAEDLFVARYGSNGTRSWVRQLGSGLPVDPFTLPNDRAFGITLDPAGDLFVTGSTVGTFGATPRNLDRSHWFVFKMKPADGGLY